VECGVSAAPTPPSLRVKRLVGRKYKRRVVYELEGNHRGLDFNVFNSNINSLVAAVKERLFYVKDDKGEFTTPPKPISDDVFEERMSFESKQMKDLAYSVSPLTKEQFLGAYGGRQRTRYERAFDSLKQKAFSYRDAFVNYFMKVEKVNFTAKPNAVPRGISPRSPRYHVLLGRYIKRIEKHIYKCIDTLWGFPTIMKGRNARQTGELFKKAWDSFTKPVAVGLDAKRFDQHVSRLALMFEHKFYLNYFPGDRRLRRLLKMQLLNKGFGRTQDGELKFKLDGGRMSGDMNTGLGNCLLMSLMIHSFCRSKNLKCKLFNNGDDCVLILESKHLSKLDGLYDYMLGFGFDVVLENPVYTMEKIEFCQTHPVMLDDVNCVMTRNPGICFSKDSISIIDISQEDVAKRWARAIGECGLSLTSGIPVCQNFYRHLMKYSNTSLGAHPALETGFSRLAVGMGPGLYKTPTAAARVSFYKAFGLSPEAQKALESYYDHLQLDFQRKWLVRKIVSPILDIFP